MYLLREKWMSIMESNPAVQRVLMMTREWSKHEGGVQITARGLGNASSPDTHLRSGWYLPPGRLLVTSSERHGIQGLISWVRAPIAGKLDTEEVMLEQCLQFPSTNPAIGKISQERRGLAYGQLGISQVHLAVRAEWPHLGTQIWLTPKPDWLSPIEFIIYFGNHLLDGVQIRDRQNSLSTLPFHLISTILI